MRARLRKFFKLPGIVRGEQAEIPAMMPPQLAQTFQIGKARPVRRRDQASSEIRLGAATPAKCAWLKLMRRFVR
jgi:hypothetical protein